MDRNNRRLTITGGISGIISVLLYLLLLFSPQGYVQFPVDASQTIIIIFFWAGALMGSFGIYNSYALYRILAWERQGTLNRMAFLFSIIAFSIVTMMIMVQEVIRLTLSERWYSASSNEQEFWKQIWLAFDGIDLGIDLAWDLFFSISLILTGFVMVKHSKFRIWFGLPYILLGSILLIFNAVTVPWPPNQSGLFDVGPLVGIFSLGVSVYMIWLGRKVG